MTETQTEYVPAKHVPLVREKDGLLRENEGLAKAIDEYSAKRDANRARIAQINDEIAKG